VLIVENDANFAHFLYDLAHEHGMKALVTSRGSAAINMAREVRPHVITSTSTCRTSTAGACWIDSRKT
jgi:DNA-binding response OmpR family regulator